MSYTKVKQRILNWNAEHLNPMVVDLSYDGISYAKSEYKTLFILNTNNSQLKESLNQSFEFIRDIHCWKIKNLKSNKVCHDFVKIQLAMSKNKIPETIELETVFDVLNSTAFIKFNKIDIHKEKYQLLHELVDYLNPDRLVFMGKHDGMVETFNLNQPTTFGICKATAKGRRLFLFVDYMNYSLTPKHLQDIYKAFKVYTQQIESFACKDPNKHLIHLKSEMQNLKTMVKKTKRTYIDQQDYENAVVLKHIEDKLNDIELDFGNIELK